MSMNETRIADEPIRLNKEEAWLIGEHRMSEAGFRARTRRASHGHVEPISTTSNRVSDTGFWKLKIRDRLGLEIGSTSRKLKKRLITD
jgi:hypothetical protein